MLAAVYSSRVYLSTDGGQNWSVTDANGLNSTSTWQALAISNNGQVFLAGTNGEGLYVSVNGGNSWFEATPPGTSGAQWLPVTINKDGSVLLGGIYGGRIWKSINSGSNWTELRPNGNSNYNWTSLATDDSGQTLLAGQDNGRLYLSRNGGTDWQELQLAGDINRTWRITHISGDGMTLFVGSGDSTGRLYVSTNNGDTWQETMPAGNVSYAWTGSAFSNNGHVFMAGINPGRLYKSEIPVTDSREADTRHSVASETSGGPICLGSSPIGNTELFQITSTKTSATLFFTPLRNNINSYLVFYGFEKGDQRFGTKFEYGPSNGVVRYTVNDLTPNTQYSFQVVPINNCIPGIASNWLTIKTSPTSWYKRTFYLYK
jgi:photosystem II stability/assembly factor-like uncharacterized protein